MSNLVLHLLGWPMAALWLLGLLLRCLRREDPALRLDPHGPEPDPDQEIRVSIIIPARNEARNIEACIEGALAQDHPGIEIIVVDDRSDDETAEIAARTGRDRVRVIRSAGPPPGWAGKPAACNAGAEAASGRWLLFLDADVRLARWAIRRALAMALARRLDLLSLWGTWTLQSAWEHILLPAIGGFIRTAQPLDRINDPTCPEAFANGQFLLFRSSAYRGLSGHERVKDQVLEDVALARAVKEDCRRLGLLLAPQAFSVRLYTGFSEVWAGFSKNLYAGMDHRAWLGLLAAGFVGFLHLGPLLLLAMVWLLGCDPSLLLAGAFGIISQILIRSLDDRDRGHASLYALSHPLGNAVLVAIILSSMLKHHLGRKVRWKGRAVMP